MISGIWLKMGLLRHLPAIEEVIIVREMMMMNEWMEMGFRKWWFPKFAGWFFYGKSQSKLDDFLGYPVMTGWISPRYSWVM